MTIDPRQGVAEQDPMPKSQGAMDTFDERVHKEASVARIVVPRFR